MKIEPNFISQENILFDKPNEMIELNPMQVLRSWSNTNKNWIIRITKYVLLFSIRRIICYPRKELFVGSAL